MFRMQRKYRGGSQILMTIGLVVLTMGMSVFAIDMPVYFAAQNQLQTATDAAALAGAQALPNGELEAEDAAMELAQENPVGNYTLESDDLEFFSDKGSFEVKGSARVPTVMAKLLCTLSGKMKGGVVIGDDGEEMLDGAGGTDAETDGCTYMTVYARSKAQPAARDTILVIDTSSSMYDLGNKRPMKDVQAAAKAFVDEVVSLDTDTVDRIGLVSFNATSKLETGLISQSTSPGFSAVKSKIDNLKIYSGSGWNTNYESGLNKAMAEMLANGRPNADKTIIFMTDGYPNLPGGSTSINTCVSYYNTANDYKRQRKTSQANTYYNKAKTCAQNYTDYMISVTNAHADNAAANDIKIVTIQIGGDDSASLNTLRTLLQDNNWDPELLDYMASTTDGDQYEAAVYDAQGIMEIYEKIATDIHVRLVN